jgi:alcohol dehydrogenase
LNGEFELRKFVAPEFVFGSGARFLLGRYLKNFAAKKVLLVTDQGIISSGWLDEIIGALEFEGYDYKIYSNIESNPRTEEVMNGA